MPKFHVVPTTEVPQRERAGREEAVRAEYVGYIDQIGRTKAGKLTPSDGETTQALRRRLGAAGKAHRQGVDRQAQQSGHLLLA